MEEETPEDLLRKIFGEQSFDTLYGALPRGYIEHRMGQNTEVDKLLAVPVLRIHDNYGEADRTYPKEWPGPEKHVTRWYELKNGKKVAWILDDELDGNWKFIVRD